MVKIIPLGGSDRVTKNLFVYEYQDEQLIVDCGIGFPEEEMLGVDLLIPDISYLVKQPKKIHGIVLTHGHDDHIAGLPYILPQLGQVPIFASKLTAGFVKDTLVDFKLTPRIEVFKESDRLQLGVFTVEPIHVTHSVPDSCHLAIHTPAGLIYHGADFKFDLTPVDGWPSNFQKMAQLGNQGVLCLLSDCLRVERPGFSLSESSLKDNFIRELRKSKGRFVVTSISSNLHRLQQAVDVAAAFGRKIAFVGRSLERNIQTASQLGYFHLPKKMVINKKKINDYPAHQVAVMVAGSQGQVSSSLVRAANNQHPFIRFSAGDRVVFSSDPIPGNERAVHRTIDQLLRLGVDVVYSEVTEDLHVSGHGSQGDLKLLIDLLKPQYLVPIGGSFRHLHFYRRLAQEMGYQKNRAFILKDGEAIEFGESGKTQVKKAVDLKDVFVDGNRIGDVGSVVLADRQKLAQDGIVIIVVPFDRRSQRPTGEPEVISRGFVFMKKSGPLIEEIKTQIKSHYGQKISDTSQFRGQLETDIYSLLLSETGRKPLILCVLLKL